MANNDIDTSESIGLFPPGEAGGGAKLSFDRGEWVMSQLYHHVRPENYRELHAIHRDAYPTAIFYLATILSLYVCGLVLILIHYMNSSYGKWAWTLNDVWDELRPSFSRQRRGTTQKQQPQPGEDEDDGHNLHSNRSKKISDDCHKITLAQRLHLRLTGGQPHSPKDEVMTVDGDVEAVEEPTEEQLYNGSSSLDPTPLSTSQKLLGCKQNNEKNPRSLNVEVVAADIVTHDSGGGGGGTFC